MTKYRSKANGNIVELSEQSAAILVPNVYEPIEDEDEGDKAKEPKPPKRKK